MCKVPCFAHSCAETEKARGKGLVVVDVNIDRMRGACDVARSFTAQGLDSDYLTVRIGSVLDRTCN